MAPVTGRVHEFQAGDGAVAVSVPAGLPDPMQMSVAFEVETLEDLRAVVGSFGGIGKFTLAPSGGLLSLHGQATVSVFLRGDVGLPVKPTVPHAVALLRGEDGIDG